MENKLHEYFANTNFDLHEPEDGHFKRFEQKLHQPKQQKNLNWKWLSAAASIVLVFTFWLGTQTQKQPMDLADISPEMEEVQNYFVSTIYQELKTVEKYRSLDTEMMIEQALEAIEDLEDEYKIFVKDLNNGGNQRKIIAYMITNYQKRLEILEQLLAHIDQIKNSNSIQNEIRI